MTRLALGTAQFGMQYGISNLSGQVGISACRSIISRAVAAGVNTIDTAIGYGDSERILGDIGVDGFRIVTKLPVIPDNIIDVERWVLDQVTSSTSRLGVDSLYALLLHRPSQLLEAQGTRLLSALKLLQRHGLTKKIGVSVYGPDELKALFDLHKFDLVQCPFSILDRRLDDSGWLNRLHGIGVEVHVRSIFLQGLLLTPRHYIPKRFEVWAGWWDMWHAWLTNEGVKPLDACMSYVLSFEEIDRVVVGVDGDSQFLEILEAISSTRLSSYPKSSEDVAGLINPTNWETLAG